jgi:hypothetical protein
MEEGNFEKGGKGMGRMGKEEGKEGWKGDK